MIAAIIAFLATRLGQFVVGGIGILALWGAFKLHYEAKGAAKEVAKFERRGETNARKAEAARRSVDSIPDDRLRDGFFRD